MFGIEIEICGRSETMLIEFVEIACNILLLYWAAFRMLGPLQGQLMNSPILRLMLNVLRSKISDIRPNYVNISVLRMS